MNNCFIILAAGKSKRFNSKIPKPYIQYKGKMLILHSIDKALISKKFKKIVVAINKSHKRYFTKIKRKNIKFLQGGKSRAESSLKCLKYIKKFKPSKVLIHDAARPDFSVKLIYNIFKNLKSSKGVIPVIKSTSSVKKRDKNKIKNVDRDKIFLTQTPQGFDFNTLYRSQRLINNKTTDDASLLIKDNQNVKLIKGEENNTKITSKNDLRKKFQTFYGIGFDVHRLVPKRKLYLGGLLIKSKVGTLGHSDGDPVLHSITDAILGACKMGDIGEMFSDKSKRFKNIRSTILLKKVIYEIRIRNYLINNLDINIITQTPKISKFKNKIINIISKICNISKHQINIKGKTTEKLGIIGKEKAIACEVIASVIKYD
tara:strand:- start:8574 stop:9689 length:1116 start_codon:yes stop_codon:yes gene_type:complete